MRPATLPFFAGLGCFGVATLVGLWTLFGQEGPIGSRSGLLLVGIIAILGAACMIVHNILAVGPVGPGVVGGPTGGDRSASGFGPTPTSRDRAEEIIGQAGLPFGLVEYTAVGLVAGAFAVALGLLLVGPAAAVILLLVVIAAAIVWPTFSARRRTSRFNEQLPDALMVVASGMRAGQSLPRALEMLARSSESPMQEELTRALAESRVGRSLVDALNDVSTRTRSETFTWVSAAIATNRQLGGNLASVLETSAETIRSREKVNKKVHAVSAEGRASAVVLIALPIVLALIVLRLNPGYMSPLWNDGTGRFMLGFATFLLVSGGLWIQRLIQVDF